MKADALNAICPYYTMYPLSFPLRVLRSMGNAGDWVLDPFCGRGTTNFAARLLSMPSIGIDSSPVAVALASAKLAHANPDAVVACAQSILEESPLAPDVPSGEFWSLAYHAQTLQQLCKLRRALQDDCTSHERVLLRAILLGALHGPRPKGRPSYFSNQSPRTFAPKPRYAVKFWTERELKPEPVDVLEIIKWRAHRYLLAELPSVDGQVLHADSRQFEIYEAVPSPNLVVTSPPYYGMRTYLPDQWLRLWFLGGPDYVSYEYSPTQLEHTGALHFSNQISQVWKNVRTVASDRTRMVVRFGGIHDRDVDPMDILRQSLSQTGWRITTAKRVPECDSGRRQVRQFHAKPRKGITEYDVYCRVL